MLVFFSLVIFRKTTRGKTNIVSGMKPSPSPLTLKMMLYYLKHKTLTMKRV